MTKQIINRGANVNDGSGDSLYAGAKKLNDNFSEIYSALGDGDNLLSLAAVATSGNYNDLTGRPTIPSLLTDFDITDGSAGQVLSTNGSGNFTFSNVVATSVPYTGITGKPTTLAGYGITDAFTGIYNNLTNLPVLFSGSYTDLTNKPTIPADLTDIGIADGTVGQVLTTDGSGAFTFEDAAGGSSLQSRSAKVGTTASLANNATGNLDITGFKGYALLAIQTDRAAWVRIYANGATRTADAGRIETSDPALDAGVIVEVITTGPQTVLISPGAFGFNFESSPTTAIPCAVTNKSGSTSAVTVTLSVLQLEA